MKRGLVSFSELMISIALFSLLLMLVFSLGTNTSIFFKKSIEDSAVQKFDETLVLTLSEIFSFSETISWQDVQKSLLIKSSSHTVEISLDNSDLLLKRPGKTTVLSRNVTDYNFHYHLRMAVFSISFSGKERQYLFSLPESFEF